MFVAANKLNTLGDSTSIPNNMKKQCLLIVGTLLLICYYQPSDAQGVWTTKASFKPGTRSGACAFSIGTKGYIAAGANGAGVLENDLWQYDTITNAWTQMASFSSTGRNGAIAFAIGTKGFVGTGFNIKTYLNDFWEWDQASNLWRQKTSFPGSPREDAAAFVIGGKGYVGTGDSAGVRFSDFWEYDTTGVGSWIPKANFGGGARYGSSGFSIGTKGYFAFGGNNTDLWEWDQAGNAWSPKASITGTGRIGAVAMSLGNFAFAGTGQDMSGNSLQDCWLWDQKHNIWTQIIGMSQWRDLGSGFAIGNVAYVGIGHDNTSGYALGDFWRWNGVPAGPSPWVIKDSLPFTNRAYGVSFAIGSKGYFGLGSGTFGTQSSGNNYHRDFWQYDALAHTWTQIANFGGTSRICASTFVIGTKGYVCAGADTNTIFQNDLWEYDAVANTWKQKSNFGGQGRFNAIAFAIGTKGFIGTGNTITGSDTTLQDFWEWDQLKNTWLKKTDFPGGHRGKAIGFSIGNKGYVGSGYRYTTAYEYFSDFWEFDTTGVGLWTQKANLPTTMVGASSFTIGLNGFVGLSEGSTNTFYEWNQSTNTWRQIASLPAAARYGSPGFSIGSNGFICAGQHSYSDTGFHDFWEYADTAYYGSQASSNGPVCSGATLKLSANNTAVNISAATFSWTGPNGFSSSLQNPSIPNASTSSSGIYTVVISGVGKADTTLQISAIVNPIPPVVISTSTNLVSSGPNILCSGASLNLSVNNIQGASISWTGPNGFASSVQNPKQIASMTYADSGTYTVKENVSGCSIAIGSMDISVRPQAPINSVASSNVGYICRPGGTIKLYASNVANASYLWVGPGGFRDTTQNPIIVNATGANNGAYNLYTLIDGCSSYGATYAEVYVNTNPYKNVKITGKDSIFNSQNDTLTILGLDTYQWSTGSTNQQIIVQPGTTTTYTVIGREPNVGCSDTVLFKVVVSISTGVNNFLTNTNLSAYPIPTNGPLNIKLNGAGYITLKIIDLLGSVVYSQILQPDKSDLEMNFDISAYHDGMYIIQVMRLNEVINKRVVVEK